MMNGGRGSGATNMLVGMMKRRARIQLAPLEVLAERTPETFVLFQSLLLGPTRCQGGATWTFSSLSKP